jgi:ketosteroid isomerase-like protein
MSDRICTAILQKIRNHPNQDRAHEVVRDLIARISAGEPLESLEALYHEDLELMREGVRV